MRRSIALPCNSLCFPWSGHLYRGRTPALDGRGTLRAAGHVLDDRSPRSSWIGSTRSNSALLILLPVPEGTIAPLPLLVHPSAHGDLRVHVVVDPHLGLLRVQARQPPGVLE